MKTLGLIGGMSYESTLTYYQLINDTIRNELGGLHSAKMLLYSVDFAVIEEYQVKGQWDKSAKALSDIAVKLEKAGADLIILCTNTMHKVAKSIEEKITVPFIHIADATAQELIKSEIDTVALLGTKYTMTQDFYKDRLVQRGIKVLIPNEEDIEFVNDVIYNELCLGKIMDKSRNEFNRIIDELKLKGAKGVILGCTEIGLLVKEASIPIFDTTKIHGTKAAMLLIEE